MDMSRKKQREKKVSMGFPEQEWKFSCQKGVIYEEKTKPKTECFPSLSFWVKKREGLFKCARIAEDEDGMGKYECAFLQKTKRGAKSTDDTKTFLVLSLVF